ncbi:lipoprotein [Paenibacillus rhizovicinus]|uniref:Lipoprotein n=1 Tax=Paenibacillus rhizovicinus TaxID=2704463 RepID=A0A6C0P0L7_9BACL|nr:lipoprotein [Paenibacillus rhizovicinus]QHW32018.1 lipoprotein [Paenibacillus rhizovicinus]
MKRLKASLLMAVLCLALTACGQKVKSFDDTIDSIRTNELIVNCSDVINQGKSKVNDIGYLCSINVNETTEYKAKNGDSIQFDDFLKGDKVRIVFSKPTNIEKEKHLSAKEIILLEHASKE